MLGNNIVQKRLLKRKKIMDDLEEAKKQNIDWKIRQLESKLFMFNLRNYPNVFWDSSNGTYIKEKEEMKENAIPVMPNAGKAVS